MRFPTKILEQRLLNSGYKYVVGIDEVGMGCLAGPVFVSAVIVNNKFFYKRHEDLRGLRDSKLLSESQREKFFKAIKNKKEICYKIAFCKSETIDKMNIFQAARLAMKRAVKKVLGREKYSDTLDLEYLIHNTVVLVDGKMKIKGLKFDQIPIVKGDRKVFTIACASIIAKVHRDKIMRRYSQKYPGYGFEKHKGYGTKYHKEQLASLGPCAIHRRSFAPVAKMI